MLLSDYTDHMEELIKQREVELHNEKKQVEDMLYSILPRFSVCCYRFMLFVWEPSCCFVMLVAMLDHY